MSNDFLFGDKTLTFIFMYKYNNIRLIYVNYKSLNNALKSALVNYLKQIQLYILLNGHNPHYSNATDHYYMDMGHLRYRLY